ncbi:TonB-dependent siderophore receptor [Novosphingobium taihuense]|uniref:Iron complex outermembrane receptor protein n=1 Tax=Novosphingobium taihuense TaxID=260085 RepID=A0A7W7ES60_9SPHN|nr:TonB-dependent siderophore receptor [Novosphingobium taihuense]MBB4611958.1 iron complex outermembrane receptor protein [Novosphingobium taihuense]TWH88689.1 iron complex outermembrane receptor protein [Novosphingobium taihuense]
MKTMSAVKGALIAGVAMGTMPMAALAQSAAAVEEEAAPAEEMVVVGQRQQYRGDVPLAAVPQTVQVIDAKTLQDLNITRLDAALDLASGIARQNNFGGLWDAFAVRGFAGDENFPSGFLVNGFNGGRGYGGPRDASNIEKIEVLKGPNGAVFGRGEPGGTVNIITKKAKLDGNFGSFALSGGSWNNYRVEGDYNLQISDTLAVRVNGAVQDGDSYRDTVHSTKYVASPSILFKPSSSTSLSYEMEFVDNKVPFDRGVLAVNGKLGVIPNSRFLGEPGDGPIRVKVLGHQVQLQQKLSSDWYFLAGFGYRDTSFEGFSTEAELALGRQILDNDGTNLARQRRYRDYSTTNTTVRGEISGKVYTGPITHHVLFGADWDRFHIDSLQKRYRPPAYTAGAAITAANNAVNIFNPVYGQLPVPTATITNTDEVQKSYGIYFQDQMDFTDTIKVRLGGRWDHFNQVVLNRSAALSVTNPINSTKERFSPTAGVLFKVTDSLSLYGGYGKGFRPNSGTDFSSNPFAPETSRSFEVGARFATPGDAISASVAAYTMKKNNILTSDPDPNHSGFSIAGGEARSRGIEADFTANLPGDLMVLATYAYTDAVWTTQAGDKDFNLLINPGDPLINIPKHAANLIVNKGFLIGGQRFTFGGGINYVGKRLGETGAPFYLPGYVLTRLMASYEPADNVKITADVTNLFDKQYYSASYSKFWIAPGAPRAFTVRASFSF